MKLEAWLALLEERHPTSIDLGLERCGEVYRRMGSPRPAKQVYIVAGTNGKGSTVAYISSICRALGQSVGSFTSPHIFKFNERIKTLGKDVSDESLVAAFEQVEKARADISLTYFEFTTLAAFLILHGAELDCAVLEVGLGGRLDTVNLVDADCVVITPIGLDHQDYLGPDIESIAREKAGVMRAGVPAVCTQSNPPMSLVQHAAELQAPLIRRERDYALDPVDDAEGAMFRFSMKDVEFNVPQPVMPGPHQLDNLAAALAATALMNPCLADHQEQVAGSLRRCHVPGRLQRVAMQPEVLLDVGHNELAAKAIALALADAGKNDIICVLAMLADKPAEAVVEAMQSVCRHWICAPSSGKRGQSARDLAERIAPVSRGTVVQAFDSMPASMEHAFSLADKDDTILVFGSFTTVSAAADWIRNSRGHE